MVLAASNLGAGRVQRGRDMEVCGGVHVCPCTVGETQGDGRMSDRPQPRRTAGRTSHDGEVAEQEGGGGDVQGDGALTLSTWTWPATAGNGQRRRNRAGEWAAEAGRPRTM